MPKPTAVNTTNADAGTDSPATFRADVLDLISKFNALLAQMTDFVWGLLSAGDAATARATLGAAALETGTTYPVGCLVMASFNNAAGAYASRTVVYGETVSGASLIACGVAEFGTSAGIDIPPGAASLSSATTWRCLGAAQYVNGMRSPATLWQRAT